MLARSRLCLIHIAACTVLFAGGAGLLAASAMAQSASEAVYGPPAGSEVVPGVTVGQTGTQAPLRANAVPSHASGSLPFTGLAVGALGGAGLLLVGVGWAIRRGSYGLS